MHTQAEEFKSLNAELIFVFREEREGPAGLRKIRDKTKTTFTLAVDLDKKSSATYSNAKMTFDNFVIGKDGLVKAVLPGTLKERATADQLIKNLKELEDR